MNKPTRAELLTRLERLEAELAEAEALYEAARKKVRPYEQRSQQAFLRVDRLKGEVAAARSFLLESIQAAS